MGLFGAHHGRPGGAKMTRLLGVEGWSVGKGRVAQRMRHLGRRSIIRRAWGATTGSRHPWPAAPNWLARQFRVAKPNQAWVSGLTYLRTCRG